MTLSVSERRMLLALAATVTLALAVRGAGPATAALLGLRERVQSERRLVAEVQAAITALPALEDSAEVLQVGVVALAPRLLAGPNEAAALTDLSARLSTVMSQHHGQLLRLDGLRDSATAGPLRRVRGRAVLETDFRGLAELLAVLERQALILVPEAVTLRQPEPVTSPDVPERLQVELELTGWYLPREAR